MILGQLRECYLKLERAEIVEKHDDDTLVDVNDIVTVDMIFGPDDSEELEFKLVGSVGAHTSDKSGIQEVLINSPLGKSVYHKKVGEKASYKVESRVFNVEIISKISEKELESGIQRKKLDNIRRTIMSKFVIKIKYKLKDSVYSSKNELFCCPLKKYLKSIN